MNYTKGEWKVQTQLDIDKRVHPPFRLTGNQYIANQNCVIAQVGKSPDDSANAHLIAAAPMMYEALKEIENAELTADILRILQPWFRKVERILAKVEGREE